MQIMAIAPGRDIDRHWLSLDPVPSAVCWSEHTGGAVNGDFVEEIRTVPIRRYRHPGWRITLMFATEGNIPAGYVMPGWIEGEPLDSSPTCTACYRHRACAHASPAEHPNIRRRIDRAYCSGREAQARGAGRDRLG